MIRFTFEFNKGSINKGSSTQDTKHYSNTHTFILCKNKYHIKFILACNGLLTIGVLP